MVYVLYKEGIYIRAILGVFSSLIQAKLHFDAIYEAEKSKPENDKHNDFDGYHDYNIAEFDRDGLPSKNSPERISYQEIKETP